MEKHIKATLEDDEIIELYWNRDESAMAHTDKKYRRFLYTIAYNLVHDRYDSEECLDDTYLAVWNRIPPDRPRVFPAFLSRIMRNIAVDRYRKSTTARRLPPELTDSLEELAQDIPVVETPADSLAFKEMLRVINSYLHTLSEQDLTIFVCRYYCSDPLESVASMTGLHIRTVTRRLRKMREALRVRLEKEGFAIEK